MPLWGGSAHAVFEIDSLNIGGKWSGRRVSNPVNPQPRMIIIKVIALVNTLIFRSFHKISSFQQDKLKQNMIGQFQQLWLQADLLPEEKPVDPASDGVLFEARYLEGPPAFSHT